MFEVPLHIIYFQGLKKIQEVRVQGRIVSIISEHGRVGCVLKSNEMSE